MITIEQLYLYPVKSLRGFTVDSALLTPQGFAHDRQWMIIDSKNRFVTQRKYGGMVLIHTTIKDQQLILSHSQQPDLEPLVIDITQKPTSPVFDAVIWKDTCQVLDEGQVASDWLHTALGMEDLRLVRMADTPRPQSKPDLLGEHTHTYFADAAPFLIANTQSLAAVNQQMIDKGFEPVPMENFRPNIVVSGLVEFKEHSIAGLSHDDYTFKHCYPCQRCVMPTVDIDTGKRHPKQQPFTLISDINPMPDNPKAPAFGENAILTSGDGAIIHVGDVMLTAVS
jgi:uncharacterized protein YcbX